ncbi:MAG: alpha/beta hydrolase [Chloroflexi bacterium]|nr:alpha/beta hydrolase [Chloroflexota bacterium]
MKLVLVHGSGGCGLNYYYQTRHFPDADAVDLPGHPRGASCSSVELYTEWLRGYIWGKACRDVVLGGHSLGGAIVLTYALKYPEEVKGLVLIGTGARLRVHPDYLAECEKAITDGASRQRWLEARAANYAKVEPRFRETLLKKAEEVGPAAMLNDLLCCDRFDILGRIAQVRVPALVCQGSEDIMTPVKYGRFLAEKIAGAKIQVFEGGTHQVMLEQPEAVNQAIEGFLRGLR